MHVPPASKIWMNGDLVDWDDAKIHVLTHGLHYGSSVFEGMRAYETDNGTSVFRLYDHMKRFLDSAKVLMIEVPYSIEELCEAVRETVRATGLTGCYIRPIAYLGYGEMGLNPLPCKVDVSIAMWEWGTYLGDDGVQNGIRAMISSWVRHDPNSIPTAAKVGGGYVNSSMAKIEAIKGGYEEAIMLNSQGRVAEGSAENLFVVRDGIIRTPLASDGALEGITKDTVVKIAKDSGYEVREQSLLRSDLYLADEVFCTGTAAEVVPITSVDDRVVGTGKPGDITKTIQSQYKAAVTGQLDGCKDWLDFVD